MALPSLGPKNHMISHESVFPQYEWTKNPSLVTQNGIGEIMALDWTQQTFGNFVVPPHLGILQPWPKGLWIKTVIPWCHKEIAGYRCLFIMFFFRLIHPPKSGPGPIGFDSQSGNLGMGRTRGTDAWISNICCIKPFILGSWNDGLHEILRIRLWPHGGGDRRQPNLKSWTRGPLGPLGLFPTIFEDISGCTPGHVRTLWLEKILLLPQFEALEGSSHSEST